MAINQLEIFIEELGKSLNINDLKPDKFNTCLLKIEKKIEIQIEMDKDPSYLFFGTILGEVPPGRYRENLFEAALKTNDSTLTLIGILAYSKKNNQLIMFDRISTKNLNGSKIADYLKNFAEKAKIWKEAIERGETPSILEKAKKYEHARLFGL